MECSNGPTDGVRNVTLAIAENRTNVTLMCFPARSCVTLSVDKRHPHHHPGSFQRHLGCSQRHPHGWWAAFSNGLE